MTNQTTNKRPLDQAKEFLTGIIDGSPEDDARIWFENAPYEMKLAAFIKLDVRNARHD